MRCGEGLGALVVGAASAAPPAAETHEGCANPEPLGVARTIEVETRGGPWLGAPHGDPELLRLGEVVLTFDDGPAPLSTRPILAALAAECTKATFFMVGRMAAAYPEVVREVAAQGHTVGTHTWSHVNLGKTTVARMQVQIEMGINAVEKAAGVPIAPFFRYPYLGSNSDSVVYLRGRNIAQLAIDVDSFDYRTHNPQRVVRQTMGMLETKGRGIILMHDIHPSTARAVPELLACLKAKGYKMVHLRPTAPVESIEVAEAVADAEKRRPTRFKLPKSQGGGSVVDWLFNR